MADATQSAVQLPPGYEDATPVSKASSVQLPAGYEDATPVAAPPATPSLWDATKSNVGRVAGDIGQRLDSLNDTADHVSLGFGKGLGDTVSGVSHLLNKIPVVGETLAPKEGITALDTMDQTHGTAEAAGKGLENIAEFAAGDELLSGLSKGAKLVALAKKYPLIAETLNLATAHPWLAKIITEGGKGATVGAIEGGVKGAQQDQTLAGAKTGAEVGGAFGAGFGAVSATAEAVGSKLAQWHVNPFRQSVSALTASPAEAGAKAAEEASQPAAQQAVRTHAPTVGASFRSGIDAATPLADAKSLYKTVDDAAKTDFKALYEKLDAAHDAAREAGIGTPEEAKAQLAIKNTEDAITDAKKVAANSGVKNVDQLLKQGDAKFAETQANKDFNRVFFGNNGVFSGNVAHGAPESIDIDKAINALENFDKPNRYGISRLQQTSLKTQGAFALKQALYDAKKVGEEAGNKAMSSRAFRNLIIKYVAIPTVAAGAGLAGAELSPAVRSTLTPH